MIWEDGTVYKGTWENGLQNGIGIVELPNRQKIAGKFQDLK